MKEIKFRVWDIIAKKMYKWPIDIDFWIGTKGCILQQYIGMSDNLGQDIYEGDIIESLPSANVAMEGLKNYIVYYDFPEFKLNTIDGTPFGGIGLRYMRIFGRVVGNVYENPELIK